MVLNNVSEIEVYLSSEAVNTDKKIQIVNDKPLFLSFLKTIVSKLTGKTPSGRCSTYRWSSGNSDATGPFPLKGTVGKYYLSVQVGEKSIQLITDKSCTYMKIGNTRRSIKVSSSDVTVNLEWLRPLIIKYFEEKENKEIEAKVTKFQNELLTPWMMSQLVDAGVPEANITKSEGWVGKGIEIKHLASKAYWSTVRMYPENENSTEEFEDRHWILYIKKEKFGKLPHKSVLSIVKGFAEAGCFKSVT